MNKAGNLSKAEEFTGFVTKLFVPTNYTSIHAILKNEGGI